MSVNPALQFAIDNQKRTEKLLAGVYGIPQDELADCGQEVPLRILLASPQRVDYPQAYWARAVRTVAFSWWRRVQRAPLHFGEFSDGPWTEDRSQDHVAATEAAERIEGAFDVATPAERRALVACLYGTEAMSGGDRVHLSRLRRKLREGDPS